jgi:hypothetical protein
VPSARRAPREVLPSRDTARNPRGPAFLPAGRGPGQAVSAGQAALPGAATHRGQIPAVRTRFDHARSHARQCHCGHATPRYRRPQRPTMIMWACPHLQPAQYRPTAAHCIKLGKSGTRRSPAWFRRRPCRRPPPEDDRSYPDSGSGRALKYSACPHSSVVQCS